MGLIATALLTGAAGLGAAAISSKGAKSAAKTQQEAQERALSAQERAASEAKASRDKAVSLKQAAAKNIKFPTYMEIPEAQEYKQTLLDRMAGRGLIDVDAQTSPIAAQVRAGAEQTKAFSNAGASARGLGRSSVAQSQENEISQSAERDIAQRMSQLELARQEQISQAVGRYGTLGEQELISNQNKAKFQLGSEFNIADTISGSAEATKQDQFAISNTISSNGATDAAWQLKNAEIWASALVGLSKSADQTTDDILGAIDAKQLSTSNAATVNVGNSRILNSGFNMASLGG